MSIRQVFGVKILGRDPSDSDSPSMTIISDSQGQLIRHRSDAQAVAKAFLKDDFDFILEQRFVLYQPDGSFFYFPDSARCFADPYLYPLEIAYGFIVDPAERDDAPFQLPKVTFAKSIRSRRWR